MDMISEVKNIMSAEIFDLDNYKPDDCESFSFLITVTVGIKGKVGGDNFDIDVYTPKWLSQNRSQDLLLGNGSLIVYLDVIEGKIDLFRPLCQKYYCEFACGVFITYDNGDSTPPIHLDARYNRLTKELNIEFDVDLYCNAQKDG